MRTETVVEDKEDVHVCDSMEEGMYQTSRQECWSYFDRCNTAVAQALVRVLVESMVGKFRKQNERRKVAVKMVGKFEVAGYSVPWAAEGGGSVLPCYLVQICAHGEGMRRQMRRLVTCEVVVGGDEHDRSARQGVLRCSGVGVLVGIGNSIYSVGMGVARRPR